VTRRLVHDFVERALGGSFGPLVAYLAERRNLSKEELDVLERIVRETEAEDAARRADKETNAR
jgi:predicted transcriptional regulator